jgi:hypothetical protein
MKANQPIAILVQKHARLQDLSPDDVPHSTSVSPRSSAVNDTETSPSPASKRRAVSCDDRPFAVDVADNLDDDDDDDDADDAEAKNRTRVVGDSNVYQLVVEQATCVERLIHEFNGHLIVLRTWLSVHIPPSVDGQNMDSVLLTTAAATLATATVSARDVRGELLEHFQ